MGESSDPDMKEEGGLMAAFFFSNQSHFHFDTSID